MTFVGRAPRACSSLLSLVLISSLLGLTACGGPEAVDGPATSANATPAGDAGTGAPEATGTTPDRKPEAVAGYSTNQPAGSWRYSCDYPGNFYWINGYLFFTTYCYNKAGKSVIARHLASCSPGPWALWNNNGTLVCGNP